MSFFVVLTNNMPGTPVSVNESPLSLNENGVPIRAEFIGMFTKHNVREITEAFHKTTYQLDVEAGRSVVSVTFQKQT